MLSQNIQTFIACDSTFEQADTVLFGAPFDSTTSYRPGARFAPAVIRGESYGIETYSPYLDKDLEDISVMDSGDIELSIGDTQKVLAQIEHRTHLILSGTDTALSCGKLDNSSQLSARHTKRPFMIGGEHLVTLGAVRAAAKMYPDLHIVHFDAHADLRDDYLGVRLSHACVLRRCWELVGDGHIHQFGIRSGERTEFEFAKSHTHMHPFTLEGVAQAVRTLRGKPVYFTLDLDVLDPSLFPGTGTPEHGGVSFEELRKAATTVCSQLNVVACDVNELSPHYDTSGSSTAAACKIIREMLLSF